VAAGRLTVETLTGVRPPTVSVSVADAVPTVGVALSVAVTVNVEAPAAVGTP
jgi:hypothetical protein